MKNGKEQLGKLTFAPPFSALRVSQPFPQLLHAESLLGRLLCEKLPCPDLPSLCLSALLFLVLGLVLQLIHCHLKVIVWPSELFFSIFSNYFKPMWEREVLLIGTPPWVIPRTWLFLVPISTRVSPFWLFPMQHHSNTYYFPLPGLVLCISSMFSYRILAETLWANST